LKTLNIIVGAAREIRTPDTSVWLVSLMGVQKQTHEHHGDEKDAERGSDVAFGEL
jgi:hypothetical protein